jgi:phosphatidylglycerol---prolipoprotein diacylglyceryl transferase
VFEAFEIGPFIIWTHLLFLVIAIWLSAEFFFRLAQSAGLSLQHFRDKAVWYLGGFALGGRLFAIIAEYRAYFKDPLSMLMVNDGSFSLLGASIGVAIVLYVLRRTSRTTFLQWLDVLLPATTFGLAFEWIGKFAAGQAYGAPTDVFWGVTYDAINVRYAVPVHPVQLYYAAFFFLLTFILLVVRKNAQRAGAETLSGIIAASIATFTFENFRGDFAIPVFATQFDFVLLILLFVSLGTFAAVELRLTQRMAILFELLTTLLCAAYLILRPSLPFQTFELRFSQLLAVLALLATVVYVVVHRRRYPHL